MAQNERDKKDVSFEIREHVGVINEYANGWTKELNMVAWNDAAAKYDIRDWNPEHTHMSRGITLHENELMRLYGMLKDMDMSLKDGRQRQNAGSRDS